MTTPRPESAVPPVEGIDDSKTLKFTDKLLQSAVTGVGPFKSAEVVAQEALRTHKDPEKAIQKLLVTHRRVVGTAGFVSGLGGLITMPVAIPADMTAFYANAARMSAAVAYIRGYDLTTDEVRSGILLSLLGASAGATLGKVGADIGNKLVLGQLKRLPGAVLIKINKAVGFRLITKAGTKGAINLTRAVPIVGGGVGAGFNVVTLNQIHKHAVKMFEPLEPAS